MEINNALSAALYEQIKGEADAMEKYAEFLARFEGQLEQEDIAQIREIISDESNHLLREMAIVKKYNKIIASSDELAIAIENLLEGVQ